MTRADYAPSRVHEPSGGVIAAIEAGSPAQNAGLVVGETILAADGHVLHDILDWRWFADDQTVELTVTSADAAPRHVTLSREPGEPWGLDFTDVLFDGVRVCRNSCAFCFMTQLPAGMRPALYLRDDDYRLSFLQGNFVTLTNLRDADIARIAEQHLSPLYVSLHAVDAAVRAELVCSREDRALERFDQLLDASIDLHVQIVLVPGVNDGEQLDRTLTWLAEREGVESVGIVPLGFTGHRQRFSESYTRQDDALSVIHQVQAWQAASRERDGITWVHVADEFYLNGRAPLPTAQWYDGFPQYENGIGLVRVFADEIASMRAELEAAASALPSGPDAPVTLVTGAMAATALTEVLDSLGTAGRVRSLAVPNTFFGGNVSVAGLLAGRDIADAIASDRLGLRVRTAYLVPDIVFNADGLTLDDMYLDDLRRESGADLRVVSCDAAGLLEGLKDVAQNPPGTP